MNILITGGSGFIGTRLIDELLKANHKVKIFDIMQSAKYSELVIIGDVRDKESLMQACVGVDIIYNLAAEHADNVIPKSLYADVNIGGAENIVYAARKNNINKIIFTSSVAVYGLNKGTPTEDMQAEPFNEYGRTKFEAEKIFLQWLESSPSHALTIVRPAVVFGESNRGNVYNLMKQIASKKFAMIGSGENKKSMGYVGNISVFLGQLVDFQNGLQKFNFAGKTDLSIHQIVSIISTTLGYKNTAIRIPYSIGLLIGYILDLISKITSIKFPVSSIRIKKFNADTTVSTKHLYESGFIEPYSLIDALKRTVKYEFNISKTID